MCRHRHSTQSGVYHLTTISIRKSNMGSIKFFIERLKGEHARLNMLAFLQGLHRRLGQDSMARQLDDYLAETIFGYMLE